MTKILDIYGRRARVTLFWEYTRRAAARYEIFEIYARASARYADLGIYALRSVTYITFVVSLISGTDVTRIRLKVIYVT